jgi:hypothetical protein
MRKKLNFIFKDKKIYKFFLYLLIFFGSCFFIYLFIPKFFNYPSNLIHKSLSKNSNINIKNISDISYKLFPSPRLRLIVDNLEFGENILEVEEAVVDIILNPLGLFNYRALDYNKFLIKEGSVIIEINKITQLFNYLKNNKKKINFKKSNIILLKEKKKLFEINNSLIKTSNQQLNIIGLFLNHKIYFVLKNISDINTEITLKIPELDISSNILLKNNNNFKTYDGLVNVNVLNNFFQFDLTKKKNIKINKGFIRNNLINTSFDGDVVLQPNFFLNLTFVPKVLNIEKLFTIVQNKYFSNDMKKFKIIKKINGIFTFDKMFQGSVTFENGKILFKNFKTKTNNPILFNARISEFGKKGKIYFNIIRTTQNKKSSSKEIKISGFMVPSISRVFFEKLSINDEDYKKEEIKIFESKFKNEITKESLSNIFNEKKINNFFNNFSN